MKNAFALGWRNIADGRRRAGLTALTAALGVALLTASLVTGLTARQTVVDGIDSLLTFGDVGIVPAVDREFVDEDLVDALAADPGVVSSLPTLSRETVAVGATGEADTLLLTGAPAGQDSLASQVVTDGRAPRPGTNEVLMPTDVADRMDASLGSRISMTTPSGVRSFDVVGLVDPRSLGVFARDNLFTDLEVVQRAFGLEGDLTRLDLDLDPAVASTWAAEHRAALPSGAVFQDTSAVADGLGPIETAVTAVMAGLALVALAVSALLGSLASTAAVRARRRTYGVLRATGASTRWMVSSVGAEIAIVAAAGTVVGVAVGVAGAAAVMSRTDGATPSLPTLTLSVGLGVLAGATSAALGARRAVADVRRIPPAFVVRGVDPAVGSPGSWPRRRAVAVVVVASVSALVIWSLDAGAALDALGLVALAACAVALSRLAIAPLAAVAARLQWAADLARRRPTRGRSTVTGALTLVVFGAVSLATCVGAVASATGEQIDRQFGADVQVTSVVPLSNDAEPRIVVDGVRDVARSVSGEATVLSASADLVVPFQAIDPETWFDVSGLAWSAGGASRGVELLRGGGGIALPRGVAESLTVAPGDEVVVSAGGTRVPLEVVGLFTSVATGQQVVIDRRTAGELGVTGVSRWDVSADEGVDVADLSDRIAGQVVGVPGVDVITAEATRDRAASETAALTAGLFAAVTVTLALGALGASSTLSLDVESRRDELAVLRTVGCRRRGIGALVAWDAVVIAVSSLGAGLLLGSCGGALGTRIVSRLLGVAVDPAVEPATTAGIVGVTAIALAFAAVGPVLRASRTEPLTILRGTS
jgi:putative ABC transport system permease protein